MKNTLNLKNIGDLLNSEGTLLGLHQNEGELYLSSYLNDKSGTVYYSVDESTLVRYYNNELRLSEMYLTSKDTVVPRCYRTETVYFNKEELTNLISCGDKLFLENSFGMRSDTLANYLQDRIK
jgi:hypothetical protein